MSHPRPRNAPSQTSIDHDDVKLIMLLFLRETDVKALLTMDMTLAALRQSSDVTLFKSVGLAIEDVAAGALVLQLAEARGIGVPLPD